MSDKSGHKGVIRCDTEHTKDGLVSQVATASLNRKDTLDGREYLIAPVVALVEGVVNGEYISGDEIGRYVDAWNGIPLPISHPMARGKAVSANCPTILERKCIGQFFNATFDGKKLRGELWIDIAKAQAMGGLAVEILNRLEQGQPLEVSTAYYRDLLPGTGTINGKEYDGVQTNLRPDHLALLPDEIGACSWEDGCGGPRTNQETDDGTGADMNRLKKLMADIPWLNAEEISHDEISELLEAAMTRERGGDGMSFYIRERYDTYFIYQERGQNDGFAGAFFKRDYVVNDNREVTMGTPIEVTRVVEYIPVAALGTNAEDGDGKARGETMEKRKAMVDTLIANEATGWTEEDREFLTGLTDGQIEKIIPAVVPNEEAAVKTEADAGPRPEEGEDAGEGGGPTENTDEEEPKSFDEWVDKIPDEEIREEMKANRKRMYARREAMIKDLAANKKCQFDKADLEAMKTQHLEKLTKSLAVEDYSAKGGPRANAQPDDSAVPMPEPVLLRKKE